MPPGLFAAGRAGNVADARRERREDRIEVLHDRRFAADHQAVAALQAPDAAAGADVDVVDAPLGELAGAADVVVVVRVAAVDDDVAALEQRHQVLDARVDDGRRHHQPDGPRRAELRHQLVERRRALRACRDQLRHRAGIAVVHDAGVAGAHEPAHHVRAHPSETDHSELHHELLVTLAAFSVR